VPIIKPMGTVCGEGVAAPAPFVPRLVEGARAGPELEPGLSVLPGPKEIEDGNVLLGCTVDAELDSAKLRLRVALLPVADTRLVLSVGGAVLELDGVDCDVWLEDGIERVLGALTGVAVGVGGGLPGPGSGGASVTLSPQDPDPKRARIVAGEKRE
jgi:hypothetical protein